MSGSVRLHRELPPGPKAAIDPLPDPMPLPVVTMTLSRPPPTGSADGVESTAVPVHLGHPGVVEPFVTWTAYTQPLAREPTTTEGPAPSKVTPFGEDRSMPVLAPRRSCHRRLTVSPLPLGAAACAGLVVTSAPAPAETRVARAAAVAPRCHRAPTIDIDLHPDRHAEAVTRLFPPECRQEHGAT